MTAYLEKIFKYIFKGPDDDPLPAIQHHVDQEDRDVTTYNGEGNKPQVAETDNTHVNEDSKTSFGRKNSNMDLSSRKGSVGVRQGTPKADGRARKERIPTSPCLQCVTIAKENVKLKTQLEVERHDLAKADKQSTELERRIQTLVGERDGLLKSANIERERVSREQMEAKKQKRDLQGGNQKLGEELNILKGTLRGVQDKHLHTVKLLEERTADLKGAQTFLTTVDRYAGAEIMKMVEALKEQFSFLNYLETGIHSKSMGGIGPLRSRSPSLLFTMSTDTSTKRTEIYDDRHEKGMVMDRRKTCVTSSERPSIRQALARRYNLLLL